MDEEQEVNEFNICLSCPLPECETDDYGCRIIRKAGLAKQPEKDERRRQNELKGIAALIEKFNRPIPTQVIVDEMGLTRNRVYHFQQKKLLETVKLHNGRGGLRIVKVNIEP
jgi:hypothetical protein